LPAGLVFVLLCGRIFQQKTHDRLAFARDCKSFFPLSVSICSAGNNADGREIKTEKRGSNSAHSAQETKLSLGTNYMPQQKEIVALSKMLGTNEDGYQDDRNENAPNNYSGYLANN
jgi:hypothetical protein